MRALVIATVWAAHASVGLAAQAAPTVDACALLSDEQVRTVQGQAPNAHVPSEQPAQGFRLLHCFFRTPDFSRSVSVAVGVPLAGDSTLDGPRRNWREMFHSSTPEEESEEGEEGEEGKAPPRQIQGVGEEAFWLSDPAAGALYVLAGDVFLRVSIGGPADLEARARRARELATYAVARLPSGRGRGVERPAPPAP
jgi:hypothetical protein